LAKEIKTKQQEEKLKRLNELKEDAEVLKIRKELTIKLDGVIGRVIIMNLAINLYSYEILHKMYNELGEEDFKKKLKDRQVTSLQQKTRSTC